MLTLLRRVGHLGQTHLRNGQLGNINEYLEITTLARNGGRNDSRLKVGRRHAHPEIHSSTALEGTGDIVGAGEIAYHDLAPIDRSARRVRPHDKPLHALADRVGGESPRRRVLHHQRGPLRP